MVNSSNSFIFICLAIFFFFFLWGFLLQQKQPQENSKLLQLIGLKAAEKQKTFYCKYCNSEHTSDLDYGLHRLSNPHVKRIRKELLQCDFSSLCRVCALGFVDLQDVENHIRDRAHEDNLHSHLSMCHATTKSTCELCGVLFYSETALEIHRLMPSHRNAASSYAFPKLNELLRQLSGLHGEHLALDISSVCSICDVQHDGLDAYILHLFTGGHISKLRFSLCLVCKKEFIHADNRESHLGSSKHLSNVQKCNNLLKESPRFSALMKRGYLCMFCMIWCSSWLCLELHLHYSSHADATRVSKAKHPISVKMNFAVPRDVKDDQDGVCDVDAAGRWREWRCDRSKEHAWCHRCGASLPSLDAANAHPEMHDAEGDQVVMHKAHAHDTSDSSSAPLLFDCCVCAISFRSSLVLAAHEASFQHHIRLAKFPIVKELTCCARCGVLVSKEDSDIIKTCKEADVSHYHISGTGHEEVEEGLSKSPTKLKDQICMFDSICVKEERPPMECANHGSIDPSVFTSGNRGKVEKDAGMMIMQRESGHKDEKNSSHVNVITKTENGSGACASGHAENDVWHDSRIPIIASATLAPRGMFHQSLRSIMTMVVKALSATLPHSASSMQENMMQERQRDQGVMMEGQPAAKKLCSEEAMKETMHNILRSIHAAPDMDDKSMDKNNMVLTVAASLVPKFSPNSWGSVNMQGEASTVTETHATEIPNNACKTIEKSIDIKLCVEQGMEGNQCDSEKSHVDDILQPVIQNYERAKHLLPHGKASTCPINIIELPAATLDVGISSICVKPEKVDELPAATMDVGMSSICVKMDKINELPASTMDVGMSSKAEKDEECDSDSFSMFKDNDLWWELSDSEDYH